MTAPRLLQLSGAVIDLVYHVEKVPDPGDEADVSASAIAVGGGFNALIAARRAGMAVAYGGAHGTGPFGDLLRGALSTAKIPILQPRLDDLDQGSSVVLVDRQGERTFISQCGAEGVVEACQLAAFDPLDFGWILLSGYTLSYGRARAALQRWLARLPDGPALVFDPGPVVDRIDGALLELALSRSAWISANRNEAARLTGEKRPIQAAALLSARGEVPGGAVVRCGAEGCWVARKGRPAQYVPGFIVPTIDSNGAGDAHVGAFIAALARGEDAVEAAAFANAAAALSTTRLGPATGPSLPEIKALFEMGSLGESECRPAPKSGLS